MEKRYVWHVNIDEKLKAPIKVLSVIKDTTIQELVSKILQERIEDLEKKGVLSWQSM